MECRGRLTGNATCQCSAAVMQPPAKQAEWDSKLGQTQQYDAARPENAEPAIVLMLHKFRHIVLAKRMGPQAYQHCPGHESTKIKSIRLLTECHEDKAKLTQDILVDANVAARHKAGQALHCSCSMFCMLGWQAAKIKTKERKRLRLGYSHRNCCRDWASPEVTGLSRRSRAATK